MVFPRIERRKLIVATLSVAITSLIITAFFIENRYGYSKRPPVLVFVKSWEAGRTEADAARDQRRDLLLQRTEIAKAIAAVTKHTNDADKAKLAAMKKSNDAAIERLGLDKAS